MKYKILNIQTILRNLLLIIGLSMFSQLGQSQRPLEIVLNFLPPYPTEFSAYFNNPASYSITVINHTDVEQDVYFLGELVGINNGVYASSVVTFKPLEPFIIPARGVLEVDAEEIANVSENATLDDLIIEGIPQSEWNINGQLPEGEYTFCINAYHFGSNEVALSSGCSQTIPIYYGDQITWVTPYEEEVIPAETNCVFPIQWNANIADPTKALDLEYELKLIDLTDSEGDYEFDFLSGALPPLLETLVDEELYIYNSTGIDFILEEGRKYGLRVRAIDPFNEISFSNNGYSEVRTFWYGYNADLEEIIEEEEESAPISDCIENCYYDDPISEVASANATLTSAQIGHFTITNINIINEQGGLLEGTGEVQVPWLNDVAVQVEFNNLMVNTQGRVYSGTATAIDDPNDVLDFSDIVQAIMADPESAPPEDMAEISEAVSTYRSLSSILGGAPTGMPIGVKEYLHGREFTVAITGMSFTADRASIDLLNLTSLEAIAEDTWLALGASDVCLTPGGLAGEAILHLASDLVLPPSGNTEFIFTGNSADPGSIRSMATYIEWDCDGLAGMAIRGEALFDRSVIVPDLDGEIEDGKAEATFEMELIRNVSPEESVYTYTDPAEVSGTHLMLSLNMEAFQIPGLEGWSFVDLHGFLDLSDVDNPPGISFPVGHELEGMGGLGLTWQGFYFENGELLTPPTFTKNNVREGAALSNIMIGSTGLSLDINVLNLVDVNQGSLDGWGFSLDTVRMSILNNNLTEGRLMGTINPPLLGQGDFLKYTAIMEKNDNEDYEFYAIAVPDGLVEMPLSLAKVALCPNSYVSFTLNPTETKINTFLKGQMAIHVQENLPDDFVSTGLIPDLSIRLADFQLNYDNDYGFIMESDVNDGTGSSLGFGVDVQDATCGDLYSGPVWEFEEFEGYDYDVDDLPDLFAEGLPDGVDADGASPQETIDGFPISINDLELTLQGSELAIDFDVDLSLSGGPLEVAIGTRLRLSSNLDFDEDGLKRFKPTGIELLCGRIGGDEGMSISPFTLKGEVCLEEYDDGSRGFTGDDIELGLGLVNLQLSAGFGKAGSADDGEYGTEDYYGWWYVDGLLRFSPGIYLGPPVVALNGFGGGVYWNVDAPQLGADVIDGMMADGKDASGELDLKPTPSFGTKSFVARTSMSLISDPLFMVDPFISGTWQDNRLAELSLGGDFWMLAPSYDMRDDARLYGSSVTSLTFQDINGSTKVAVQGQNEIYADIIPNLLYGAGTDKKLISNEFIIASEDMIDHESNSDDDDVFWFFNAGNPYDNDLAGIVMELPGFNLDQTEESGNNIGIKQSAAILGYAMVGQNIPTYLPPPPDQIAALSAGQDEDDNNFSGDALEQEERASQEGQTGHGLAFGVHAIASSEINAVFYASLAIYAGLDILLVKNEDNICYTSAGSIIEDPGVNGWYGTGRAYAGMEGKIGVKGKLFGKEIDVVVMHLIAAIMVEAGGPDPMWLDGRASLSYSLLNGTIKGSTRMMISVGEKCVPPVTSPFDFPIIAESYPDEMTTRDIDPFVSPTVSFTVPIGESIEIPGIDPITPWETRIFKFRAMLDEEDFSLSKECTNCGDTERDTRYDLIAEDGRSATYNPEEALTGLKGDEEEKEYTMNIKVYAEEYIDYVPGKSAYWNKVSIDGEEWEESREITFTTMALPGQIDEDQIGKTKPFRNQKFYMQGETTHQMYVHTRDNLEDFYFYDEDIQGKSYDYEVVIKNNKTQEEVYRAPLIYESANMKAKWDRPASLDNNTEFLAQLIRSKVGAIDNLQQEFNYNLITIAEGNYSNIGGKDVDFSYEVTPLVPDLSPAYTVGAGEELIYSFIFETSKYNTLTEKMAEANIEIEYKDGFQRLDIIGTEGFDEYDIIGKLDDDSYYSAEPKVSIEDPFTSPFLRDEVKPVLEEFTEIWNSAYYDNWHGVFTCIDGDLVDEIMDEINDNDILDQVGSGWNDTGGGGIRGPSTYTLNYRCDTVKYRWPRLYDNYDYSFHYDWREDVSQPLNEHVNIGSYIKQDEEDDDIILNQIDLGSLFIHSNTSHRGPNIYSKEETGAQNLSTIDIAAGGTIESISTENILKIKYYVTDDIIDDAYQMVEAAEENIDFTENSYALGTPPLGQAYSDATITSLLAEIKRVKTAIENSDLVDGTFQILTHTHGGSSYETLTRFSNEIKFTYNTSYEDYTHVNGTSVTLSFKSNKQ